MNRDKPGFVAIRVSANKLAEHGYRFAVILEDNQVKAYGVSRDAWIKVEAHLNQSTTGWGDKSYTPLVVLSDDFKEMARQMAWVIVGDER
jgi:hypothetical protein